MIINIAVSSNRRLRAVMSSTKRLVLYSCKGKASKYKENERSVGLTSQLVRYYINEVEEGSARMLVKCYIHNKKRTLYALRSYIQKMYIYVHMIIEYVVD